MTVRNYLDFDVLISGADPVYTVRVLRSPAGEASMQAPADSLPTMEFDLLNADRKPGDAEAYGRALFASIFVGDVRDLFVRSVDEAQRQKAGLRIRLRLTDAPALSALSWELLYSTPHARFLGPSTDTTIMHYLDIGHTVEAIEAVLPVRVLVVAASSSDLELLEVEQEWQGLHDALSAKIGEGSVVLHRLEPPTRQALQSILRREPFHVLHFVGHGIFDPVTDNGMICLLDRNGGADAITGSALATLLHDHATLRLAVLNTCEGAVTSTTSPFSGVAHALVRQGLPAVIAMQRSISEQAARVFASAFYAALADDYLVDAALSEACKEMKLAFTTDEWATPRLVTHARDLALWKFGDSQPPAAAKAVDRGLKALAGLLQDDGVRNQVIAFRTNLEAASGQFALLSSYKNIHDGLHQIEVYCYRMLVREVDRFPEDDEATIRIEEYLNDFQIQLANLHAIAERPDLPRGDVDWIGDLVVAGKEMWEGLSAQDRDRLRRGVVRLRRLLDTQPTRINSRLTSCARALRVASIAGTLRAIDDALKDAALDPGKFAEFERGVTALEHLRERLFALVDEHDRWQELDVELRRVESQLAINLDELLTWWPDIREQAEPLLAGGSSNWAAMLAANRQELDAAILTNNPSLVRRHFHSFRRGVGNRFFKVDTELKMLCGELHVIAEPLSTVMRILT